MRTMLDVLNANTHGDQSLPQHVVLVVATTLHIAAQLSLEYINCDFTFSLSSMNPVCAYCR